MIFGDPSRFAIEIALDEEPYGVWLCGYACLWISGNRVGDWEKCTSLRDLLFQWERISCDAGARYNPGLMSLDTQSLAGTLARGMTNYDDASLLQRGIDEQWANHEVGILQDVFIGWHIYLVEDIYVGRCLYHDLDLTFVREQCLKTGEFDRVLKEAVNYLKGEYDRALEAG